MGEDDGGIDQKSIGKVAPALEQVLSWNGQKVENQEIITIPFFAAKESSIDEMDVMEEVNQHVRDTETQLGLRALSILRYLTDHMDRLSLGLLSRLVSSHDTPGLMAAALQR